MSLLGTQSFTDKARIAFSDLSADADYSSDVTARDPRQRWAAVECAWGGLRPDTIGRNGDKRAQHRQYGERNGCLPGELAGDGGHHSGPADAAATAADGHLLLLPLYLVVARYSLEALVIGALGIFTVKFWTALWYAVSWLDEKLIAALYPGQNEAIGLFVMAVKSVFGGAADGALASA